MYGKLKKISDKKILKAIQEIYNDDYVLADDDAKNWFPINIKKIAFKLKIDDVMLIRRLHFIKKQYGLNDKNTAEFIGIQNGEWKIDMAAVMAILSKMSYEDTKYWFTLVLSIVSIVISFITLLCKFVV